MATVRGYRSLRHTFASVRLSESTPVQWVAQQQSHADIKTTYMVYGMWLKAWAEGASDALDSVPWQQQGNTGDSARCGC